jgi:hypothetical protein
MVRPRADKVKWALPMMTGGSNLHGTNQPNPMKRLIISSLFIGAMFAATFAMADDADALNGKWSVKKVNDEGQNFTQTLEIKKDKFVFQILSGNQVVIHAEGNVKFEKLGPFKSAHFSDIRGGDSPSNLSDVDDEYTGIYTIEGDTWTLASNFDKKRKEKPSVDAYHRMAAASGNGTLVIDEIEMADTPQTAIWYFCLEATVNGVKKRHFVADKGYDKNQVTIPVGMEFPKADAGQKCSFWMQLDDIEEDTCGGEPDQRSTGEFTLTERGSQTYKPEAKWRYTIRWHLK